MIIKVSRGSDFDGLYAYLLRHGQYQALGEARILTMEGVYDEQTASAQMTYNAALAPKRTRPVVHLMARAERDLTDEQYRNLATRIVGRARLNGHPFMAVVHDDGHIHIVACEMDDEGRPPARWLWHATEKREVTDIEAAGLPRGEVTSRAWDSHLSWRLTELAREVELEWGLVCLSSSSKTGHYGPSVDRWQQERLEKSAEVALQDRYYHQVRAALALKRWDDRIEALAEHGLTIRPHHAGGRVRGLQVQSLTRAQDFVKISAFGLGGMPKLDASADQPFLNWERTNRTDNAAPPKINLGKPAATFDPELARLRALFLDDLKAWNRTRGRRNAAFKRYARAKLHIVADVAQFETKMSPLLSPKGLRNARREKRAGMSAAAKAGLATELTLAGPDRARPIFIDFVKARAGAGDVGAAVMYQSLVAGVSETRRLHERKLSDLAAAVHELRARAAAISASMKDAGALLRVALRELADRADVHRAAVVDVAKTAARRTKDQAAALAARLAEKVDAAGHRIRVRSDGPVVIDRWSGDATERQLIDEPAHRPIFVRWARSQSEDIRRLAQEVYVRVAVRDADIDVQKLPASVHPLCRWSTEPEITGVIASVNRMNADAQRRRDDDLQHARTLAKDRAAADRTVTRPPDPVVTKVPPLSTAAVSSQHEQIEPQPPAGVRGQSNHKAHPVEPSEALPSGQTMPLRDRLLAELAHQPRDGWVTKSYLNFWKGKVEAESEEDINDHLLKTIEVAAIRHLIETGASKDAILKVVSSRSVTNIDPAGIFDAAVEDKKVADKFAYYEEKRERLGIATKLLEFMGRDEVSDSFIDKWTSALDDRPIDASVDAVDRNRSVDFEVMREMLDEGIKWSRVSIALRVLSPSMSDISQVDKNRYLEDIEEYFGFDGRPKEGLPKGSGDTKMPMSRDTLVGSESIQDELPDELPAAPPTAPSDQYHALSDRMISAPVGIGRVRPVPDRFDNRKEGEGCSKMIAHSDTAGKPEADIRSLVNAIKERRQSFEFDGKRIKGRGLTKEEQQKLDSLMSNEQVRKIVISAWQESSPSVARGRRDGWDR